MVDPEVDVEILYTARCAHVEATRQSIREAVRALDLDPASVRVREVRVDTLEAARDVGMPGSPTVRVNGNDLTGMESRPHIDCREYVGENHAALPYPPPSLVREGLQHRSRPMFDFEG